MAEPKRYFTKYVRDYCKSGYQKADTCRICGAAENLDFHHFKTVSILVNDWVKKKGLKIETEEDAFKWREVFAKEHETEMYDEAVTLCRDHHQALHSIYGKNPKLGTAAKQARWVERQRAKNGLE